MKPRTPLDLGLTTPGQQRAGVRRLVMLAAVILGLSIATRERDEGDRPDPASLPDEPPDMIDVRPPTPGVWAEEEEPPRSTPRPGARQSVPRVTHVSGTPTGPDEPAEVGTLGVDARPAATPETIQAAVHEVLPDIEDCLHQWWMLQPELSGRVVMEFQLLPEGLQDAIVLDHDGVPAAVMSCFGSALYEGDFPAGPPEGLTVTYPFVFDGPDEIPEGIEADSDAPREPL